MLLATVSFCLAICRFMILGTTRDQHKRLNRVHMLPSAADGTRPIMNVRTSMHKSPRVNISDRLQIYILIVSSHGDPVSDLFRCMRRTLRTAIIGGAFLRERGSELQSIQLGGTCHAFVTELPPPREWDSQQEGFRASGRVHASHMRSSFQ